MRVVIQKVLKASVSVDNNIIGKIENGLMVLLGIENSDEDNDIDWLSKKIINLRIFDDENGIMNKSLTDVGGDILLISQFTLHASTKKGNRPSYIRSAKPDLSLPIFNKFKKHMEDKIGKKVPTGKFGANMQVELINDGPVTIIIDSKNKDF